MTSKHSDTVTLAGQLRDSAEDSFLVHVVIIVIVVAVVLAITAEGRATTCTQHQNKSRQQMTHASQLFKVLYTVLRETIENKINDACCW